MFPPINTREMQYLDASLVSMLSVPLSSENPPLLETYTTI